MKYLTLATASGQDYICISTTPVSGGNLPSDAKCIKLRDKTSALEGYCPASGTQISKENYFEYDSSTQELVFYKAESGTNCQVNYTQIGKIPKIVNSIPFEIIPYSSGGSINRFIPNDLCFNTSSTCAPLPPSVLAYPYVFVSNSDFYVNTSIGSNTIHRINLQTGVLETLDLNSFGTISIPAFNPYKNYLYVLSYQTPNTIKIFVSSDYGNTFTQVNVTIYDYSELYFRGALSLPDKQIFYFSIKDTYGSQTSYAIYSTDGLSGWTGTSVSPSNLFEIHPYNEIIFTGSKILMTQKGSTANTSKIKTSTDGFSWTEISGLTISTAAAYNYMPATQRKIGNYVYFGGKPSYFYNTNTDTFVKLYDFHVLDYVTIGGKTFAFLISKVNVNRVYEFQGAALLDLVTNKLYDISSLPIVTTFSSGIILEYGYIV